MVGITISASFLGASAAGSEVAAGSEEPEPFLAGAGSPPQPPPQSWACKPAVATNVSVINMRFIDVFFLVY
jgi:hypothetical protein